MCVSLGLWRFRLVFCTFKGFEQSKLWLFIHSIMELSRTNQALSHKINVYRSQPFSLASSLPFSSLYLNWIDLALLVTRALSHISLNSSLEYSPGFLPLMFCFLFVYSSPPRRLDQPSFQSNFSIPLWFSTYIFLSSCHYLKFMSASWHLTSKVPRRVYFEYKVENTGCYDICEPHIIS